MSYDIRWRREQRTLRAIRGEYDEPWRMSTVAKAKKAYVCSECGSTSVKWAGQCPECLKWNTLTETTYSASTTRPSVLTQRLEELEGDVEQRHTTGFGEFDRVLGHYIAS